jgi:hypothetical protein
MADIEKKVVELATKARENKLSWKKCREVLLRSPMAVYFGSLMSTTDH